MEDLLAQETLQPLAAAFGRAIGAAWGEGDIQPGAVSGADETPEAEPVPLGGLRLAGPVETAIAVGGDLPATLCPALASATAAVVGEVCGQEASGQWLDEVPEVGPQPVAMDFTWRRAADGSEGQMRLLWDGTALAEVTLQLQQPAGTAAADPFPLLGAAASGPETHNIEMLLDVPLELTVELGRAEKQIREILALGSGAIVELNRLAGEPVDVLVNGKLIACGEVVVIDESFGVRITDILTPEERLGRLR